MKPDPKRLDDAIYPFTYEITTRFADMDFNGHINNVAYATFFEHARVQMNRALLFVGEGRHPALVGYRNLIVSVTIDYLREGAYGPPVLVAMGINRIGNTSFGMGGAIFQNGQCLAVHEGTIACKGPNGEALPEVIKGRLRQHALKGLAI